MKKYKYNGEDWAEEEVFENAESFIGVQIPTVSPAIMRIASDFAKYIVMKGLEDGTITEVSISRVSVSQPSLFTDHIEQGL